MTDKQIKEELKQVVTNLGNIKFTVEDELKFCKEVLKRKEQECEELKKEYCKLEQGNDFLAEKNSRLTGCLAEIKDIAGINPINTCWTVLELCEKCNENKECDIQCPLFKFNLILQKISEVENAKHR